MPDTDITTDDAGPLTFSLTETVTRMKDVRDETERIAKRAEDGTDLDSHDRTRWEALKAEFERLRGHKASLERKRDLDTIRAAFTDPSPATQVHRGDTPRTDSQLGDNDYDVDPASDYRSAEDIKRRNPWDTRNLRTYGRSTEQVGQELRARALDAVEKMPGASRAIREAGTAILEQHGDSDGKLARLTLALSDPAYMRSFMKQMSGQPLAEDEQRAQQEARSANRAMSLTDAAGGFLVPFQLDPSVIITSAGTYNELRRIARTVVATGDVWNGVSAGAVSWSFDAEAAEVSDDTPTFAGPAITIRTARGFVPISLEAYQDGQNVTAEIGRLLAEGKEDLEAAKFISGVAASNEPVGLMTTLSAATGSHVASATADTFAVGDLHRTKSALPAKYRSRASWLANEAIYSLARQGDTSDSMWRDLSADRPPLLLGKPVYEAEAMDGVVNATVDNFVAVFGDFSQFVIADRIGMTVETIPHLFGANGRPTGQRGWFAHYRVGTGVTNTNAFRVYNVT